MVEINNSGKNTQANKCFHIVSVPVLFILFQILYYFEKFGTSISKQCANLIICASKISHANIAIWQVGAEIKGKQNPYNIILYVELCVDKHLRLEIDGLSYLVHTLN
jgi:hypothetical protein